jgi:DNA ligase (NAD+)
MTDLQIDIATEVTPSDLAASISFFNTAYRSGQPAISDEEYDMALEQYRGMVSPDDYAAFARTLTEVGGDVKHPYIVGSLKKVKFGEGKLMPWVQKHASQSRTVGGVAHPSLLLMAKINGLSYVASYVDGVFHRGSTRGDGYFGREISNKLCWILPPKLSKPVTMDIRGEITLSGEDHIELGFRNRLNGSVGLINRDNAGIDDISKLKGYAYQIKSGHMADATLYEQLMELLVLGFKLPEFAPAVAVGLIAPDKVEEHLAGILADWKSRSVYDIDGLVICGMDYILEDEFYPEGLVAFKVNQEAVPTTVLDIEWNVSKNGTVKPVVIISPIEIKGSTVGRVTGYNAQWLLDNGIGAGTLVGVIKSGDIIPKIIEIYQAAPVVFLGECPCCGTSLDKIGVDLVCTSEFCGAQGVKEVESFLVKLGVDGTKSTTLENLGIQSFEALLSWRPDVKYKGQTNLYAELEAKAFNAPADKIFSAMLFDGFGRKMVGKLIEFYGSLAEASCAVREVAAAETREGFALPEGFTDWNISKAAPSWMRNLDQMEAICADPRYRKPAVAAKVVGGVLEGKSFLFTGTISMPRKQAEALVTGNGGTIASGVSKTLSYLVAGEAAGSKLDKATKLGIAILTEQEFKGMVAA